MVDYVTVQEVGDCVGNAIGEGGGSGEVVYFWVVRRERGRRVGRDGEEERGRKETNYFVRLLPILLGRLALNFFEAWLWRRGPFRACPGQLGGC